MVSLSESIQLSGVVGLGYNTTIFFIAIIKRDGSGANLSKKKAEGSLP